jgi:hypothetical protein
MLASGRNIVSVVLARAANVVDEKVASAFVGRFEPAGAPR